MMVTDEKEVVKEKSVEMIFVFGRRKDRKSSTLYRFLEYANPCPLSLTPALWENFYVAIKIHLNYLPSGIKLITLIFE